MAKRHDRANISLMTMSERGEAFLDGLKLQLTDAKEIGQDALSGSYTPQKWFADMTALWINGAALAGAWYAFPLSPAPAPEPVGAGSGEKKSRQG